MDRRLRELQEELAPSPPPPDEPAPVYDDGGPRAAPMPRASVRPGVAPAPVGPDPVGPQADVLALMYRRLLASMRELLDGYELLLSGQAGSVPSVSASADRPRAEVTVSAGPFSGTPALRDFERALAELSGVRGVSLRGYDSDDRAIWDVELR
jgi:sirohydrochlorin ferrochelatase